MHILLVADGRSPITLRWLENLLALQHRVTLVSTYPCNTLPVLEAVHILPVAFAGMGGSQVGGGRRGSRSSSRSLVSHFRAPFLFARYHLGPLTLPLYRHRFRQLVENIQPDLVHALRIPFEGMLACATPPDIPFLTSVWGNDLTLHAPASGGMRRATKQTLHRADGLIADAWRDMRLARQWGYDYEKPTLVVPGNGGIDLTHFQQSQVDLPQPLLELFPENVPLVINPRGLRAYVRNDVFFQAIPLVIKRNPRVHFVCPSMAAQPEAILWVERLQLQPHVTLLTFLPQHILWGLFSRCAVSVSITTHDGTPNTLLETMASGAFPIAGDIEALREWITPGVNGLLVDPSSPQGLAEAILLALEQNVLRRRAAEANLALLQQRAEASLIRAQVEVFYQRFIS